ncbi:hypothetical protein ACO0LM_17100 [Undibacterium sp. Di26W]
MKTTSTAATTYPANIPLTVWPISLTSIAGIEIPHASTADTCRNKLI